MDRVDHTQGVFITAEGLLMYLEPDDALGLIRDCAARFPGGQMMFDSIPHWFSRRTLKGLKLSDRYVTPPMPFALTADEGVGLADRIPGVRAARDVAVAAAAGHLQGGGLAAAGPLGFCRRIPAQHHAAGIRLMTRYAAFLRGVNVGGVNLKMAEVAKAFEDAGFTRCTNDFGQRQCPAGEPFRGGRGQEEGREGVT